VAGDGQQVDVHLVDINGDFAHRLHEQVSGKNKASCAIIQLAGRSFG
jgi:hypothetical protein